MGRIIHVGNGPDSYARIDITDEAAEKLVEAGLLYACGDEHDHDLHINPEYQGVLSSIETLLLGVATSQGGTGGVKGLPVAGYKPTQPEWALDLVNENKVLEERVLRQIEKHSRDAFEDGVNQRCVAIAKTKVQEAFMWLNRGVFQPSRVELPEDSAPIHAYET